MIMSDLDIQLREILSYTTQEESIQLQVDLIKRAFKSAGYVTGAEWLERFEEELGGRQIFEGTTWSATEEAILAAAQRASGVKEQL